jgi:4-hydroxy-tetrahydrodipicolinate reductase
MKIGLIGFGKTGKAVASVLLQHPQLTLEWVYRRKPLLDKRRVSEYLGIDSNEQGLIFSSETMSIDKLLDEHPVEIIIDFSSNEGIRIYGNAAAARQVKIISAISHYSDQEVSYLHELAKRTLVFWSPNITLGVNYLIFVSKLLQKIAPWVDIEIIEQHFKGKDGISGTAIKIAETLDLDHSLINSVRAGGIVGKHEVIFGFPNQTVRIIHESISREAFGNGTVFVAQNIIDKPIGFYTFEDILKPFLNA